MTREDIEHLVEVCESVSAQIRAGNSLDMDNFDSFVDRMLWAIHSSAGNPNFDVNKFHAFARSGEGEMSDIFGAEHPPEREG